MKLDLPILSGGLSRRTFIKAVGATAAAAGIEACWEPPTERILPYAQQPPELVPGVPMSYATASILDGYATGLLVQTREGRPIKVEGNPEHPASLGGTSIFDQAFLLDLYAADRMRGVSGPDGAASRRAATEAIRPSEAGRGEGLAILLEPTSSPLRANLLQRLQERFPAVRIYFHSARSPSGALEAYRRGAGRPLLPRYDFERARTVVAFDADFVSSMPFAVRYAHDFAAHHSVVSTRPADLNRLYVAEPAPSGASTLADHVLRVRAGDVPFLLGELVRRLGGSVEGLPSPPDRLDSERSRDWVAAAASDLLARPGEGLVVVGDTQPAGAHALAHEANRLIGAFAGPVVLQEPALERAGEIDGGLARLTDAIGSGAVDHVIVLEGDPVRTSPADVAFGDALESVPRSLYLGLRPNATAGRARWTVPQLHLFETWGDARAYDGTLTPVQPLIRPLDTDGMSPDELLQTLLGTPNASVYDALRAHWLEYVASAPPGGEQWELWWDDVLRSGVVSGTAFAAVAPPPLEMGSLLSDLSPPESDVEISFRLDGCLHDGRFAANPWLQELPDPTTKLSWANAALMSPRMAAALGVERGDAVRLEVEGRAVEAPAFPLPGHADGAVTLTLGHGPDQVGRYKARGVDAYRIRPSTMPWAAPATVVASGGDGWDLPLAQTEQTMHDRPVVLHATLSEYLADPDLASEQRGEQPTWYGPLDVPVDEHQWGMSIDLSRCMGCSACAVACRAENNIAIVGPEDVRKGRLMHWLRIDAYTVGPPEEPEAHLRQPMLCQHCEDAPCEYVCPTYATVHSADGLNEMIYNRCIGTRFCSNNCPYKIRRFNWLDYTERPQPVENLVLNPDVTVRGRGVMEKCSYCVQRIRRAEIEARNEGRDLERDQVVTACQQACPTQAIVFGDIADPGSAVSRLRESPLRYDELHELGTRPRTQYLARVSNPRPAEGPSAAGGDASPGARGPA